MCVAQVRNLVRAGLDVRKITGDDISQADYEAAHNKVLLPAPEVASVSALADPGKLFPFWLHTGLGSLLLQLWQSLHLVAQARRFLQAIRGSASRAKGIHLLSRACQLVCEP